MLGAPYPGMQQQNRPRIFMWGGFVLLTRLLLDRRKNSLFVKYLRLFSQSKFL